MGGRRGREVDVALGVVPFIDVLLVLVVLLVLLAAGQIGRLSAVPVSVPQSVAGAPVAASPEEASVLVVSAEGIMRWEPRLERPALIALPENGVDSEALLVFCAQAGIRPGRLMQVAATPESTHAQMIGVLELLQRCGVHDVAFLLRPPSLE